LTETLLPWLELSLRWGHVVIGSLWIGASFYLISWENKFNRAHGLGDAIEGEFWTIQGGDFYRVEKLRRAPPQLPAVLHWFKYEAYLTWLTGFVLLCLLFYAKPSSMLVGGSLIPLSPSIGIAIGLGSLVLTWVLYDLYCSTRLARNLGLSAVLGLSLVGLLSLFFTHVFGPRAAFIHVGAVLGTFMSGNVFFRIIPWHRKLIRAIEEKQPVEALYASHPGFRSRHNHYLSLPVIFIMLSGHFPIVLGHPYNWLLLTALTLAIGLAKHAHTRIQRKQPSLGYLAAGTILFAGILVFAAASARSRNCETNVSLEDAAAIVQRRCTSCHSATPTDDVWTVAPNGVIMDTPEQIEMLRARIVERVVYTRDMPPQNKTSMTPEERKLLQCWAAHETD
jgi:uncharacterized membrane protein